ncbi:MAG: class I tRNA ligase family protein, partial [Kiritimatiellae bacterium]|nr:class I tRNA ligase family protein [Kiritimatiellia bacterium]
MVTQQPIVDTAPDADQLRMLHATIKKVTEDLDSMSFNTAISQMMIFVNAFAGADKPLPREAVEKFVLCLAPFAPHLCEELWEFLGHTGSLAYEPWPTFDEAHLKIEEVEILIQVLGRPKARMMMPADADAAKMQELALANEPVQQAIACKTVRKVVCVPGRLVNIVAN